MIDINELRMLVQDFKLAGSPMLLQTTQMGELLDRLEAAEKTRDTLRAKIAEMEKTWLSPEGYHILMQEREDILFQAEKMKQHAPCKDISMWPTHHTQPTQPAPSVSDGWLRAIDEALVTAHIGVANAHDTYEQAKAKLDNLIGLHVDIATDPAVNGGWKLVPIVSTEEMDNAGSEHCDGYLSTAQAVWDAMLAAAPEAKP